jgi:tape measure domain-containing protein
MAKNNDALNIELTTSVDSTGAVKGTKRLLKQTKKANRKIQREAIKAGNYAGSSKQARATHNAQKKELAHARKMSRLSGKGSGGGFNTFARSSGRTERQGAARSRGRTGSGFKAFSQGATRSSITSRKMASQNSLTRSNQESGAHADNKSFDRKRNAQQTKFFARQKIGISRDKMWMAQKIRNGKKRLALEKQIAREAKKGQNISSGGRSGGMGMGAMLGAVALGGAVSKSISKGNEFIAYEKSMAAVSKSQEQYNDRLRMTQSLAHEVGLDIGTLGKEYSKFVASNPAMSNGGMTEEQMQRGFGDVVRYSSIFSKSPEDTNLAMKALTQMLGKGKISAEELRGQLGERMSGSFKLFAEGMGMSVGELDKAMSDGLVLSADALPKFFDRLNEEIERTGIKFDSAQHAFGRMQNAWTIGAGKAFKGGFDKGLAKLWDTASLLIEGFSELATSITPLFFVFMAKTADAVKGLHWWMIEIAKIILMWATSKFGQDPFGIGASEGALANAKEAFQGIYSVVTAIAGVWASLKILKIVKAIASVSSVGAATGGAATVAGAAATTGIGAMLSGLIAPIVALGWMVGIASQNADGKGTPIQVGNSNSIRSSQTGNWSTSGATYRIVIDNRSDAVVSDMSE